MSNRTPTFAATLLCLFGGLALAQEDSTAPAATGGEACADCVAGPWTLTKPPGPALLRSFEFSSRAGSGYELVIDQAVGLNVGVTLNGAEVVRSTGRSSLALPVVLETANTLGVTAFGRPGEATLYIRATEPPPLPSCGPGEVRELFSSAVMDPADLVAVEPLGALNAPDHTLPTHHIYMNTPRTAPAGTEYPVFAPGDVRIVAVEYAAADEDFQLHLRPCAEVRMYLLHIEALAPWLADRLGPVEAWSPIPDTGGAGAVALTAIDVSAGEHIGTDMPAAGTAGVDVGLIDERQGELAFANRDRYVIPADAVPPGIDPETADRLIRDVAPRRLKQFCALDYFDPTTKLAYESLLGAFDGTRPRLAPPICGEHMQDLPGTAQGNWFRPTTPEEGFSTAIDESDDFAFVHDYIDPSVPVLSLSPRGPVIDVGAIVNEVTYAPVEPPGSGRINLDPSAIVPAEIHCFENLSWRGGPVPGLLFVQLTDATTIRVGYLDSLPSCAPILDSLPPGTLLEMPELAVYER